MGRRNESPAAARGLKGWSFPRKREALFLARPALIQSGDSRYRGHDPMGQGRPQHG